MSDDIFLEVAKFEIGKRAFHIDLGRNYAIVADYEGKVSFIDIFTLAKSEFSEATIPMGALTMENFFMLLIITKGKY